MEGLIVIHKLKIHRYYNPNIRNQKRPRYKIYDYIKLGSHICIESYKEFLDVISKYDGNIDPVIDYINMKICNLVYSQVLFEKLN